MWRISSVNDWRNIFFWNSSKSKKYIFITEKYITFFNLIKQKIINQNKHFKINKGFKPRYRENSTTEKWENVVIASKSSFPIFGIHLIAPI